MAIKDEDVARWARLQNSGSVGRPAELADPINASTVYELPKAFFLGPPDPWVKPSLEYDGSLRECACRLVTVWRPVAGKVQQIVFSCDKSTRSCFARGHSNRVIRRLVDATERGFKASLLPSDEQLEPLKVAELMNLVVEPNTYELHASFTQRRLKEENYTTDRLLIEDVRTQVRRR